MEGYGIRWFLKRKQNESKTKVNLKLSYSPPPVIIKVFKGNKVK